MHHWREGGEPWLRPSDVASKPSGEIIRGLESAVSQRLVMARPARQQAGRTEHGQQRGPIRPTKACRRGDKSLAFCMEADGTLLEGRPVSQGCQTACDAKGLRQGKEGRGWCSVRAALNPAAWEGTRLSAPGSPYVPPSEPTPGEAARLASCWRAPAGDGGRATFFPRQTTLNENRPVLPPVWRAPNDVFVARRAVDGGWNLPSSRIRLPVASSLVAS